MFEQPISPELPDLCSQEGFVSVGRGCGCHHDNFFHDTWILGSVNMDTVLKCYFVAF